MIGRMARLAIWCGFGVAACLVASGCRFTHMEVVEPPTQILLITIDTLRADRGGAYGWQKARTPFSHSYTVSKWS